MRAVLKWLLGSAELVQYVKLSRKARVISIQTTLNSFFLSGRLLHEAGHALFYLLEHLLILLVSELLPVGVLAVRLPIVGLGVDAHQHSGHHSAGKERFKSVFLAQLSSDVELVLQEHSSGGVDVISILRLEVPGGQVVLSFRDGIIELVWFAAEVLIEQVTDARLAVFWYARPVLWFFPYHLLHVLVRIQKGKAVHNF